jgi:flagellar motor switch/type III secretory pathway protein FliN
LGGGDVRKFDEGNRVLLKASVARKVMLVVDGKVVGRGKSVENKR